MSSALSTKIALLIFFCIAILILWQALLPGYILTLDMVFGPSISLDGPPDAFNNMLPIRIILYAASLVVPVWLLQKVLLLLLFVSIGFISYLCMPGPKLAVVRLFSALVYTLNPFVYSRLLAGHWQHLFAYSLLPLVVYLLISYARKPAVHDAVKVFAVLGVVALFSVHFFVMGALLVGIVIAINLIKKIWKRDTVSIKKIFISGLAGTLVLLVITSYWTVPALIRPQPLEQRFDEAHWLAFSAAPHDRINTSINLLSLNGFWGERETWALYFAWPQDYLVFWIALGIMFTLAATGLIHGLKNKTDRYVIALLGGLGIAAYILAAGAGDTVFKPLNLWLYENIAFWSGFRDSQKFIGLLAFSYAGLSGYGLGYVLQAFRTIRSLPREAVYAVLLVPIFFGHLMWGGFQKQLRPAWYPASWFEAKAIIDSDPRQSKVLFLPWRGYMSFNFNNNVIVANPAKIFFGSNAIVSRTIDLQNIYDQEQDAIYRALDNLVRGDILGDDREIELISNFDKIGYIVIFQDLKQQIPVEYDFTASNKANIVLTTPELVMYKIEH